MNSKFEELSQPVENPEAYRREKPTLNAQPIAALTCYGIDYASAGNLIDQAIHHLDEALPVGQKRRAELAFAMLDKGVEQLRVWMREKGYEIG